MIQTANKRSGQKLNGEAQNKTKINGGTIKQSAKLKWRDRLNTHHERNIYFTWDLHCAEWDREPTRIECAFGLWFAFCFFLSLTSAFCIYNKLLINVGLDMAETRRLFLLTYWIQKQKMHQLFFLCCFIFALHLSEIMLFLFCLSLWRCRFVVVFVLKSNSSVSHSMVSMKNQVAEAKHTNTHTRHHLFSNPVGWVFFFFYLIRCGCCWFAPIYLFSLSFFSLFFVVVCILSLDRIQRTHKSACAHNVCI